MIPIRKTKVCTIRAARPRPESIFNEATLDSRPLVLADNKTRARGRNLSLNGTRIDEFILRKHCCCLAKLIYYESKRYFFQSNWVDSMTRGFSIIVVCITFTIFILTLRLQSYFYSLLQTGSFLSCPSFFIVQSFQKMWKNSELFFNITLSNRFFDYFRRKDSAFLYFRERI